MVKKKFPELTLLENKENVGFSKANNQAVKIAQGEYVCILNPDTAVGEATFSSCLQFAEQTDNLGAIGVRLIDGTGNFLPESKRNVPTPKVSLLKILGFSKSYYATKLADHQTGKVDILVGAFMFLERTVYNEVHGFDEDYFMYGEDIDLSYKIKKAGYDNYYLGSTTVLHYKGESTQKDAAYLDRFYGAMQIFYNKHFDTNYFLDSLVKMGVSMAKRRKVKNRVKTDATISNKNAVALTENFTLLRGLTESFGNTLKASSKSIFQDSLINDTLFVFDVDYMPYSQIFGVMHQLKNRNNYFRIRPSKTNYILGSDTSDEKGTVTVF